jgi:hypothetical protein
MLVPDCKKWLAYSTLLGNELFLAELCVPKHLNSLLYHRELLIAPIFALLVGAFVCLALVVAAYVDAVGWLALAIVAIVAIYALLNRLAGFRLSGALYLIENDHANRQPPPPAREIEATRKRKASATEEDEE